MNKDEELRIRVSKEEKLIIAKKAESMGLTLSQYVRCASLFVDVMELVGRNKK